MALPTTSGLGYFVQFHYPAECRSRGYIVRAADRESTLPKKNQVKRRRQPPTPPKRIRWVSRERNDVKEEERDPISPCKKSSAGSTIAPDDDDSSEDSDDISTPSPVSVEIKSVKEELEASGFHAVCFVGILNDPKSAARTMSKTQKKVVMKGVLDSNHHDALFSHCLGLSSFDASPSSNVVVFTSFPRIFAGSHLMTYGGPERRAS